jgi:hypothetical protein
MPTALKSSINGFTRKSFIRDEFTSSSSSSASPKTPDNAVKSAIHEMWAFWSWNSFSREAECLTDKRSAKLFTIKNFFLLALLASSFYALCRIWISDSDFFSVCSPARLPSSPHYDRWAGSASTFASRPTDNRHENWFIELFAIYRLDVTFVLAR